MKLFFLSLLALLLAGCASPAEPCTIYADYLKSSSPSTYDLIYLNDDDTPELVTGSGELVAPPPYIARE